MAHISIEVSLEVRGGEIFGIAVSPATVRTSCSPRCPESAYRAGDGNGRHRRCGGRTLGVTERAAHAAPPSCRRNGSATAPRRA